MCCLPKTLSRPHQAFSTLILAAPPLSFDILRHALRRYICKQLSTFDADGRSRLDYANPCQISLKSLSHSLMLASFLPVSMPNELIQLITAF